MLSKCNYITLIINKSIFWVIGLSSAFMLISAFVLYLLRDVESATTDFDAAKADLEDYLPRLSAKGSGDDVSIAAVMDLDIIGELETIKDYDREKEKARVEENARIEAEKAAEERRRIEAEHAEKQRQREEAQRAEDRTHRDGGIRTEEHR